MEDKHSHKKQYRSHHTDRRQPLVNGPVTMVTAQPPVVGAYREPDSGELHKKAQNIFGSYADYQSAFDNMDTSGPLKGTGSGTSDSSPLSTSHHSKTKMKRSDSGASAGGRVLAETTPILQPQQSEKDKSKRGSREPTKDLRKGSMASGKSATSSRGVASNKSSSSRDMPEVGFNKSRKKPSSRTPVGSVSVKAGGVASGSGSKNLKASTGTEDSVVPSFSRTSSGDTSRLSDRPGISSGGNSRLSDRPASRASNSSESTTFSTVTKKLKKRKKSPENQLSNSGRTDGKGSSTVDQLKSRPEDLFLSEGQDVETSINDAPDTGDVQHMLEELLHPPPLSLVTPIATPKNGTPFIFPSSAPQVQKQPLKESKTATSSRTRGRDTNSRGRRKLPSLGSVSSSSGSDSSSSSSCSSSSSGSSGSESSSGSSSSDSELSDNDDATLKEENVNKSASFTSDTNLDFREEATTLTLEKLQEIGTFPNVTITPLKKTPPHFMSDDAANLSPAKHRPHISSEAVGDSSSHAFNSQTSMGFQLVAPGNKQDFITDCHPNSDSSNSDEESMGFNLNNSGTTAITRDFITGSSGPVVHPSKWSTVAEPQSKAVAGRGRISRQNPVMEDKAPESLAPALNIQSKKKKKKRKQNDEVDGDLPAKKLRVSEFDGFTAAVAQPPVMPLASIASTVPVYVGKGGVVRNISGPVTGGVRESVTTHGPRVAPVSPLPSGNSDELNLIVSIPLSVCKVPKPKAKVEPYNVVRPTPQRRSTSDGLSVDQEESRTGGSSRDLYVSGGRMRPDEFGGNTRDMHSNRMRGHMGGTRWEREDRRTYGMPSHAGTGAREFSVGTRTSMGEYAATRERPMEYPRGGDYGGRGHIWEREGAYRGGEEYWSDYEGSRMDPQRPGIGGRRGYSTHKIDPDSYMLEARKRKKEADKITTHGLEKAKLYMESVTLFMRHGGALEAEGLGTSSNSAVKRNPYKMYSDTVAVVKYCQAMAGDYKPLLVLCLRCLSVLYWRMFLLKQNNAASLQKDLQEFFLPSKSKSPFPGGGFSPLPSPASVGSTASTGSGSGGVADSTSSSVSVPKAIYSKASDYLAVSSHVYTCLEMWRLSDTYMDQCREFFINADRKASLSVHYYSSIFQVASWVDEILKSVGCL